MLGKRLLSFIPSIDYFFYISWVKMQSQARWPNLRILPPPFRWKIAPSWTNYKITTGPSALSLTLARRLVGGTQGNTSMEALPAPTFARYGFGSSEDFQSIRLILPDV